MSEMIMNKQAHTITELLVVSFIIVILFASVLGAFVLTKSVYSDSIANYNLQRDVNGLLYKIIRGIKEPSGTFGLRSALPPSSTSGFVLLPAALPANSEIDFFSTDGNITPRKYLLISSNNTVVYESPTQSPRQKIIYTAPANSTIILRFSIPLWAIDDQIVTIYISVSQQIGNKTATGSVTTNVNLRNAPK